MKTDKDDLKLYIVPMFVVAYGEHASEAVTYVEHALDSTELIYEDGIFSVEVLEDEVELYE